MRIVKSCIWSLKYSFRSSKLFTILIVLVSFLLSIFPSIQIILIENLADQNENGSSPIFWVALTGVFIGGYLATQQILYSLQRFLQIKVSYTARKDLLKKISDISPKSVSDTLTQKDLQKAKDSIETGDMQMQSISTISLGFSIIVALSLFFTISRYSIYSSIFVLGCLVPMIISYMLYARIDAKVWPLISEQNRYASYRENQIVYKSTALDLANLQGRENMSNLALKHRKKSSELSASLESRSITYDSLAGFFSSILLVLAIIFLLNSDISNGALAGGLTGIFSGILATSNAGYSIGSLISGANAVGRFRNFIESDNSQNNDHKPVSDFNRMDFSVYQAGYSKDSKIVISDVHITASTGDVIALVGSNGAGKTTIVNSLRGLTFSRQSFLLDGVDYSHSSSDERNSIISLLSQDFGRYELTIRENLLLPHKNKEFSDNELYDCLHSVGLADYVKSLKSGLDTPLGEQWGGIELSGGQWQRLAIARVLLLQRPIRIFDEPTSAIDAESESKIFDLIYESSKNFITIVISHRAWVLKRAKKIYVIEDGKAIESGNYDQLMKKEGKFYKLFKDQLK